MLAESLMNLVLAVVSTSKWTDEEVCIRLRKLINYAKQLWKE